MLVGHFAVGLAAKRMEPTVSLGTLVMASMMADLLWSIFMLAGVEHVQFKPAMGAANYIAAFDTVLSHSLLMDGVWAGLLAAAWFLRRRNPRGAWILFGAVLSHWVLDWISHRPDMALLPGVKRYFGLGLWGSIPATLLVEGGFWLLSVVLYARATHPGKRAWVYGYWMVVAVLTLAWYNNVAGPPPRDPHTAPLASFLFFSLAVAWAYWMNRLRPVVGKTSPLKAGWQPGWQPAAGWQPAVQQTEVTARPTSSRAPPLASPHAVPAAPADRPSAGCPVRGPEGP